MASRISCAAKRAVWLLTLIIGIGPPVFSQKVIIDYASGEISCPEYVGGSRAVPVRIDNVNDILYSYEVKVESSQLKDQGADDFSRLSTSAAKRAAPPPQCVIDLNSALSSFNAIKTKFDTYADLTPAKVGDKYVSITLSRTKTAWKGFFDSQGTAIGQVQKTVKAIQSVLGTPSCPVFTGDDLTNWNQLQEQLAKLLEWEAAVARPHQMPGPTTLMQPGFLYKFQVIERYKNALTLDGSKEFPCQVSSPLTLSAGTLISTMRTQSFRTVQVPKVDPMTGLTSDETFPALALDGGSSVSPHAMTLLNYKIPVLRSKPYGFSVSSGPVFRLAGETDASSVGYFGGISVNLWDRFFLTPGVHIGEFSDFPIGFTQGSFVPPNFGTLSPTKRWTGRFAIGLTYRTNAFRSADIKGTANNLPPAAQPSTPPTLEISTAKKLPDAQSGTAYTVTLAATGGKSPYEWAVTKGSLPSGLSLAKSTGVISGTPSGASPAFSVTVTDASKEKVTKEFTITVTGLQPPIIATQPTLPDGAVGSAYDQTLAATAGQAPYTWTLETGSSLPAGLSLSPAGQLSGTPTAADTTSFTIVVTDSAGASVEKQFTLEVK